MQDIEFLTIILQGLASDKESISIDRSVDEMGVLLTVSAAKPDMGKIIGRQGTTINAVRHLMKCFGYGLDMNINVKVNEPIAL